ncbi:MAG TPA: hypothetical protein PK718_06245 [Candidatus Methanofastidiosa archaeon]|nr:hypothetical protein [Candidatus Methanofastidiosa archaeon]
MRWDKVNEDSYYRARQYEYMAKRLEAFGDLEMAMECWKRFSDIKMEKGSYFLAYFGKMQVLRLARRVNDGPAINDFYKETENLRKDDYLILHDMYYNAIRLEIEGKIRDSVGAYEELGDFFKEKGNFFLAADAYDHAAEGRHKLGMPVKDYGLPQDAWNMNANYWLEKGEDDDSKWSKERREYYEKLYRD